ncbi:MAG: hypothetical protein JO323_07250 [Acidobacteriia bacterium]|nr:hypothetical protein [Terriglobia bacterium]
MKYVLRRGDPPVNAILLVESGSRGLLERLLPTLRTTWGDDIFIDIVSCYTSLPQGFRSDTTRLYCVSQYRGRDLRRALYSRLAANQYAYVGIICSAEKLMTKWKWALALKLPARLFIINENADFFWFDRFHWRVVWRFVLYRSGLSGANGVRVLAGLLLFPFTLLYLLLYATAVHLRRAVRRTFTPKRFRRQDAPAA